MEALVPVGGAEELGSSEADERAAAARILADLPQLAPRGVGEVLDTAVDVLRLRFLPVVGFAFAIWIPVRGLQALTRPVRGEEPDLPAFLLAQSGAMFVSLLITSAVALITLRSIEGRDVRIGEIVSHFFARLVPLIGATFMSAFFFIAGAIVSCGILGIYLAWRFLFVQVLVVLERRGVQSAFVRSFDLTRSGFVRWLGVFVTANLLTLPFSMGAWAFDDGIAQEKLASFLKIVPPAIVEGLGVVLSSLLFAVPSAFLGIVVTVFYLDVRVRVEGFDLELELGRLERDRASRERPPRPPGPPRESFA